MNLVYLHLGIFRIYWGKGILAVAGAADWFVIEAALELAFAPRPKARAKPMIAMACCGSV